MVAVLDPVTDESFTLSIKQAIENRINEFAHTLSARLINEYTQRLEEEFKYVVSRCAVGFHSLVSFERHGRELIITVRTPATKEGEKA